MSASIWYSGVRKMLADRWCAPVAFITIAANDSPRSGRRSRAFDARQVVEAVAVLQVLHLQLEDEVEGRAQHAVVQVLFLGEAADPEVDLVETGDGAGV